MEKDVIISSFLQYLISQGVISVVEAHLAIDELQNINIADDAAA